MIGFICLILAGIVTGIAYWFEMAAGWWLLLIFGVAWLILYILIKASAIARSGESYSDALIDVVTFESFGDSRGWGGDSDGGGWDGD